MFPFMHVGGAVIPVYGVLVTLGYGVGALWLLFQVKKAQGTVGEYWALGYTLLFGALTGAKIGYYIVEWDGFLADPWAMLTDWKTGWVFWSGFIGSMVAGKVFQLAYNRLYRPRRYLQVADYFGPGLALGMVLGRIGCFAAGCCHGAATILQWGVRFSDPACSVDAGLRNVPLHPVQLLEAGGNLAMFLFFAYWVLPRIRARKLTFGTSFLGYIILYGVMRFFLEFLRGDDRGDFLWPILSPSQWVSLGSSAVAGATLYRQGIWERNPEGRTVYLPDRKH